MHGVLHSNTSTKLWKIHNDDTERRQRLLSADDGEEDIYACQRCKNRNKGQKGRIFVRGFIVTISLTFTAVIIFLSGRWSTTWPKKGNPSALESFNKPGSEDVEFIFPNFDNSSPYKGYPSVDLESAWDHLLNHGIPKWLAISTDALADLKKGPTHPKGYHWYNTDDGRGKNIEAVTEMWHQLHCLDVVRKYIDRDRWDYSGDNAWQWGMERLREHVDHCVDVIRVALTCYADMTPVLEYEKDGGVWLDFETVHQCRRVN